MLFIILSTLSITITITLVVFVFFTTKKSVVETKKLNILSNISLMNFVKIIKRKLKDAGDHSTKYFSSFSIPNQVLFIKKGLVDWESIFYIQYLCFKEIETKKDVYAKISIHKSDEMVDFGEVHILYYPWSYDFN